MNQNDRALTRINLGTTINPIENLDINTDNEVIDDDSVLIEDDNDIDPATDVGIKPPEKNKEEL